MLSRRKFLRNTGFTALSLGLLKNSNASSILNNNNSDNSFIVHITGRVQNNQKGISNVAISDGVNVFLTDYEGNFEFESYRINEFLFISLPSGYKIPQSETGTSKFYKKIKPDKNNEMYVEFNLEKNDNSDVNHSFLLLADPQTLDKEDLDLLHSETVPDVIGIASEQNDSNMFGVSCGDIMYDRLEYFPSYEKAVKKMGIPFFQVLGNHDCEILASTDEESADTFKEYFGPNYYSFNRGKIHYVVVDDVFWYDGGYIGYLTKTQLDWLKADLENISKDMTVIVFAHIPIYCESHKRKGDEKPSSRVVVTNREKLYSILDPFKSLILCGHTHECEYLEDGGSEIHIGGAVCGAWWTGEICTDGTPKGYTIYKVKGNEISWQYKTAGQNLNHQVRLYSKGSIANHNDSIVANIWGYDKYWKVIWFEDGQEMGEMEQIVDKDPLAIKLYKGDDIPKKHNWVEPSFTDHLFIAKPNKNAKLIKVVATDRFGRHYSEEIHL